MKNSTTLDDKQHQVNGWWLETGSVSKSQWPRLERLLNKAEMERAERFHFKHDQQSYIAAHALTRAILSIPTGIKPTSWRFTTNPFGKPEVILPPSLPRLKINLSHTRGMVAVALSIGHDIGVDVEWLGRRKTDIEGLSKQVFTSEECAILDAAPQDEKQHTFLSFWTLKEAYIKATGKGFSQPLDSFHFCLAPLAIHFIPPNSDDATQWQFKHFQPTPEHVMALAVHHPKPKNLTIRIEAAPLETIVGLE